MAASSLQISAQAIPENPFQRNEKSWSTSTAPWTAGLQWPTKELLDYLRTERHLSSAESSQSIPETFALPFTLQNETNFRGQQYQSLCHTVAPEWPRRLLHVPTMTSIERREGNWYGTDFEPAFNALSYRWGKWTVKDGPRLDIHGVSWAIPAVDQNFLSVNDFQKILQRMTHDTDYIWIDIACVDQSPEGVPVRMDEIHKEPGIYRKARNCYVWLHGHEPRDLKNNIDTISSVCAHIGDVASDTDLPYVFDPVAQMASALTSVLRDPWFSTVWTLREILFPQRCNPARPRRQHPPHKRGHRHAKHCCSRVFRPIWTCRPAAAHQPAPTVFHGRASSTRTRQPAASPAAALRPAPKRPDICALLHRHASLVDDD